MTIYTYTQSVNIQTLTKDVQASVITIALDHIETIDKSVNLYFKSDLPDADKAILDQIVAATDPAPTPDVHPINVVQVLGKDSLTLSPRGMSFIVPKGTVQVFDKQLDTTLVLRGGILYSPNSEIGDILRVSVIDKDNVLGIGINPDNGLPISPTNPFFLGQYVKEWYVMPCELNELVDISISQTLPEGVYIRVEYTSTSTTADTKVIINFISYEFTV